MVRFSDGDSSVEDGGRVAPVIPLFGDQAPPAAGRRATVQTDPPRDDHCGYGPDPGWHTTWEDDYESSAYDDEIDDEPDSIKPALERLIKRLRRRGLSISEAMASLRDDGVDQVVAEVFIAELEHKRWLGDADLAEQLVHTAVTRRGEGRRAIAQTLAKRGIARDVADAALAALPDDDAERALEYARSKATSMARLDRDTAVRRLVGQLARRGYPGSTAQKAARQAIEEVSGTARAGGVRFD